MEWIKKKLGFKTVPETLFIRVSTIEGGGASDASVNDESESTSQVGEGILSTYFKFLYHCGLCPFPVQDDTQNVILKYYHQVTVLLLCLRKRFYAF